jgi:hypothetical protein
MLIVWSGIWGRRRSVRGAAVGVGPFAGKRGSKAVVGMSPGGFSNFSYYVKSRSGGIAAVTNTVMTNPKVSTAQKRLRP